MTADVAIIGAGILGLATARELLLRDPDRRIAVFERERAVATHQSSHNSGVVHAGIYYPEGSEKALLCSEGRELMYGYCDEHGIEAERCGKVIIALDDTELGKLDELERRATANGVPGLRRVGRDGLAELEPHAVGVAALHSPQTGIVDFGAVARSLAAEVARLGGEIRLGHEVTAIERAPGGGHLLRCKGGEDSVARRVIACAGLWSDRVARSAGLDGDPRIIPFRGRYLELRHDARRLVRSMIYPVPDPALPFLGVHLTRQAGGGVVLGPSALMVGARDAYHPWRVRPRDLAETLGWPGTRKVVRRFWRTGLTEMRMQLDRSAFIAACRRYVPELRDEDVAGGWGGIRAQAVARDGRLVDDFVFSGDGDALHVRNAPSPAATSSLAIARRISDRLEAGS